MENLFEFNNLPVDKDTLLAEYESQDFDMESHVRMHWHMDNIVLVNAKLCKDLSYELGDDYCSPEEEYNIGLWTTLIHEIRHAELSSPILQDIDENEVEEDAVEEYFRNKFEELKNKSDYMCFKLD